jgi:hypothetical protein
MPVTRRRSARVDLASIVEQQEQERQEIAQAPEHQPEQTESPALDGALPSTQSNQVTQDLPQNTAKPQSGKTVKEAKPEKAKITIYPTKEQADKLDDLAEAFRRKTGFKIKQQDIIRRLLDVATVDLLLQQE